MTKKKLDPNEVFETFWKEIVCNEDGTLNIDKVKAELSDFYFLLNEVPKVYCHVTGNTLSKPFYSAEDVIRNADDSYRTCFEMDTHDTIDTMVEDGTISKELADEILIMLI